MSATAKFLVFQLQAPMAAWGTPAVGEYRGSHEYPSESALLGLLGAALGIRRDDESALARLRDGYGFVIGVQNAGSLLRDYHTAQVPGRAALKGRPRATRRDELSVPKEELNTILSTRDYRMGARSLVAVCAKEEAPFTLQELATALRTPRFVLYLGRKSCPPAAPLWPVIVECHPSAAIFEEYLRRLSVEVQRCGVRFEGTVRVSQLVWGEGVSLDTEADFTVPRKDHIVSRRGWQFADRTEHVKIVADKS